MLAGVQGAGRPLASSTTLCRLAPPLGGFSASNLSLCQFIQGGALEPSGSATRCFFPAIDRIAEHFRHGGGATEEMDLKPVGLFFCTHLCVDASDVCFGLRIRPAAHNDKNKLKNARINELCTIYFVAAFPARGGSKSAIFFDIPLRAKARNKDGCPRATRQSIERDRLRPWSYTPTLDG